MLRHFRIIILFFLVLFSYKTECFLIFFTIQSIIELIYYSFVGIAFVPMKHRRPSLIYFGLLLYHLVLALILLKICYSIYWLNIDVTFDYTLEALISLLKIVFRMKIVYYDYYSPYGIDLNVYRLNYAIFKPLRNWITVPLRLLIWILFFVYTVLELSSP
jgi:hypothetical protein